MPALQDELRDEGLLALDDSEPPATTDVRLVATFIGCDYKDSGQRVGASIRTTDGDLVTIPRPKGRDFVDATTPLPIGTTWRIGWVSDEVHPDGTRLAAQSAGTFTVGDRPLLATATYRCRESGAYPVDGAVAEVIWPEPGPGTSASPAP